MNYKFFQKKTSTPTSTTATTTITTIATTITTTTWRIFLYDFF